VADNDAWRNVYDSVAGIRARDGGDVGSMRPEFFECA
jgi:hypothetical protein